MDHSRDLPKIKPAGCTCQYPDLIARNMCGHGTDPQGKDCPVLTEFYRKLEEEWAKTEGIPRRQYKQTWTPAEEQIKAAVDAVEEVGAHPLLTEAVVLLQQAFERLADYIDMDITPAENPLTAALKRCNELERVLQMEVEDHDRQKRMRCMCNFCLAARPLLTATDA